ncbi:hypothetical protein CHS0354_025452 [Potamilus streckersoni]|uniref:Uncharacterized protein n=1 Tax=Potamilus streckersoni TaxID=2493646 RepID=A0AAE0T6P0_9BIVA|nr:hypothetical protein CHS0354_025452 [Potamilus streckersoni]
MPTEKKLKILAEKCLQFSSAKLQDEFKDFDGFEEFNGKVKAALMKKFEVMEGNKDFYHACHQTSVVPNPVNEEMDKIIIELEAYISKLRKESDQWDKLVSRYENLQSEDLQIHETGRTNEKEEVRDCDLPDEVKLSASNYLVEPLDLHEIRKEITLNAKLIPLYKWDLNPRREDPTVT